jgi:hypothetical protein
MMSTIPQASADTGAGGFTILHAGRGDTAHTCNVVSGIDSRYQAVVCADLVTYEGATDYYVYARAEAICQTSAGVEVACDSIADFAALAVGDGGNTGAYPAHCGAGYGACPDARVYADTRTWVYKIADAGNGACSSNANSSYDVWGLVLGYHNGIDNNVETSLTTPDTIPWDVGYDSGYPNDGHNESTGHYYICP